MAIDDEGHLDAARQEPRSADVVVVTLPEAPEDDGAVDGHDLGDSAALVNDALCVPTRDAAV